MRGVLNFIFRERKRANERIREIREEADRTRMVFGEHIDDYRYCMGILDTLEKLEKMLLKASVKEVEA